ncbi:MAG TPA: hypothetical protein PLT66_07940, partial [Bacillota bacterium]|nr:hypothetical protein [Bacillota bacterium]
SVGQLKKLNEMLSDNIFAECEKIRTQLFTEWQDETSKIMSDQVQSAADKAFSEAQRIIELQNETIEKQGKKIDRLIGGYRVMKYLCYAIIAVAIIVFAAYPLGILTYDSVSGLFQDGSYFPAAALLVLAIILIIFAIVLVSKLAKKNPDKTK